MLTPLDENFSCSLLKHQKMTLQAVETLKKSREYHSNIMKATITGRTHPISLEERKEEREEADSV